jgi:hypothetical protein
VLTVGKLLDPTDGANPHRRYDPADVEAVANAITADLQWLDPAHASDYAARRQVFETGGLAQYHALIAAIRARYGGLAVGASESIFAPRGPALGLDLITPPSFMRGWRRRLAPILLVTTEGEPVAPGSQADGSGGPVPARLDAERAQARADAVTTAIIPARVLSSCLLGQARNRGPGERTGWESRSGPPPVPWVAGRDCSL